MSFLDDIGDYYSDLGDAVGETLGVKSTKGEKQAANAVQELQNLQVPTLGEINPEQYSFSKQDPTAFGNINIDPRLRNAQFGALQQLRDIATQGGLTPQDKQLLAEIQRDEEAKSRGQRGAIMQNAQARGVGGSGLELGNLLNTAQTSSTNAATRDLGVAGMAQQRALDAIRQSGSMAGDIRGQEYQQAADKARATDVINQFNTGGLNRTNMGNVDIRNDARMYNNRDVPMLNYQNQLSRVNALNGLRGEAARAEDARKARLGNTLGNAAMMAI